MDDNDVLGFFRQLFGDNTERQKKELTKMYIQGRLTKEQFMENMRRLKQGE